jgi:hypothetical protein
MALIVKDTSPLIVWSVSRLFFFFLSGRSAASVGGLRGNDFSRRLRLFYICGHSAEVNLFFEALPSSLPHGMKAANKTPMFHKKIAYNRPDPQMHPWLVSATVRYPGLHAGVTGLYSFFAIFFMPHRGKRARQQIQSPG